MLKKKVLFFLFIFLALLMAGYLVLNSKYFKTDPADAGSFGISPPYLNAGDIHPGENYSETITLMRGQAESGDLIETSIKADDFADWLSFDPPIAYFSKGQDTITIRVTLNVPVDAYAGAYQGDIIFGIESASRRSGVGIALGARALVSFVVKDGKTRPGTIEKYQVQDSELYRRLAGKILIIVDNHGQAFYVDKDKSEIISLRDYSAFESDVKKTARGISQSDLWKIPVAVNPVENFNLPAASNQPKQFNNSSTSSKAILDGVNIGRNSDADADGLADYFEEALGTDKNLADSDNDGFGDAEEISHGFIPVSSGDDLAVDGAFAQKQSGRFFLAVENRGELWFVSSLDDKRYLIANEVDLLNMIRRTASGILKNNFDKLIKTN